MKNATHNRIRRLFPLVMSRGETMTPILAPARLSWWLSGSSQLCRRKVRSPGSPNGRAADRMAAPW